MKAVIGRGLETEHMLYGFMNWLGGSPRPVVVTVVKNGLFESNSISDKADFLKTCMKLVSLYFIKF